MDKYIVYFQFLLMIIICSFPFVKEKSIKLYHPMIFLSALYLTEYGISSIYMVNYPNAAIWFETNLELIKNGFTFSILVYIFVLLGFYTPRYDNNLKKLVNYLLKKIPNINNYTIQIKDLPTTIILLLFLGWISRLILIKLGIYYFVESGQVSESLTGFKLYSQYLFLGSLFPHIVVALVFLHWIKHKQKRYLVMSFILLLIEVLYALPTGSKERILMPVYIILVLYSFTVRVPIIPIAIVTLFVIFFIFPITEIYRISYSGDVLTDLKYSFEQYLKIFTGYNTQAINDILFSVFGNRLNYANVISRIVAFTPEIWNYKLGETYTLFFISLIPRIFWQSKPDLAIYGNSFGRSYNFISPGDFNTSVDMTWVGEIFINFGWYGIIFAFFIGFFYQLIYVYFMRFGKLTTLSAIMYSFALYNMLRGGMLALQFAGFVKMCFVLLIVCLPFLKKVNAKQ